MVDNPANITPILSILKPYFAVIVSLGLNRSSLRFEFFLSFEWSHFHYPVLKLNSWPMRLTLVMATRAMRISALSAFLSYEN